MKRFLCLVVIAAACQSKEDRHLPLPPNVEVLANDSNLHNNNGTWHWKNTKFSGYIVEKSGDTLLAKLPIIDGKENGVAYGWYKNGQKRYENGFLNGNREGVHKGWYANGRVSFLYFFRDDKYEGEQKTFYESGHRWQSLNYVNGYEEGKQKSWSDSGRVVNNFTVKNGKLYGVVGRYDCMSVIKK